MPVTNSPQEGCVYALTALSAHSISARPPTAPPRRVDLVVVGAGLAGCSGALEAARRGMSVVLLEASTVGAGQSGRCGGQVIPGFEVPAPDLFKKFGAQRARALMQQSLAASMHLRDSLAGCPALAYSSGGLVLGHLAEDEAYLRLERAALDQLGLHTRWVGSDMANYIRSPLYRAGLYVPHTWHTNPLRVCQFLAKQAQALGAQLLEYTPATGLTRTSAGWTVDTPRGPVSARNVFLAGGDTVLLRHRRMAPTVLVRTWQVATAVLPANLQAELLPSGACAYDVQDLTMDYFRLQDGRLILGGGDAVARKSARGVDYLRERVTAIFPQLAGVELEHYWHGDFDVSGSRMPVLRAKDGLWLACGYSGHGTANAYGAGRWAVQAMLGDPRQWELFSQGRALPFPAHHRLRSLAGTLGAAALRVFS